MAVLVPLLQYVTQAPKPRDDVDIVHQEMPVPRGRRWGTCVCRFQLPESIIAHIIVQEQCFNTSDFTDYRHIRSTTFNSLNESS